MKNNWKDFVQFTSAERRGVIGLCILAIICASYSYFVPQWVSNRQIAMFEKKYAEALLKARKYNDSLALMANLQIESSKNVSLNPNTADTLSTTNEVVNEVIVPQPMYLNSVTAQQLIRNVGVEKEVAFRIIKFRDGLGGFYSKQQLKEVFGVSDKDYQNLISKIAFNKGTVKKININSASLEELQAHSYISPKLAKQIINYREKVKPFASAEDVLKLYMVDENLHRKIMPYVLLK